MTVSDLLLLFDKNYISIRLKPTTANGYRVNIYKHLVPHIGSIELEDLKCIHLDELCVALTESGLNNTSIIYVIAVLRKALNYAVQRELCSRNVAQIYDKPQKNKYRSPVLDESQIEILLEYAKGSIIYPAILLACHYGLRRGEILGLRGYDIDQKLCLVNIERSLTYINGNPVITDTKSDNSCRIIKTTYTDMAALSEYIEGNKPICPLTTNQLQHLFKKMITTLELPNVRFHDLRHSYATVMLKRGIPAKAVSSVLGHSRIGITLDLYSHFSLEMQDQCLQVWEKRKKPT